MPNNATAKTASAPKRRELAVILAAVLLGVAAFLWYLHVRPTYITLTMTDMTTYTLEVASSPKAQTKGLGGRPAMAKDQGMLFTFPGQKKQCFWMKGMQFPLDIVWLNQEQKVIAIKRNVSPDTYPQEYCAKPTMYVIELYAGQADRAGIQIGQTLNF